MVLGFHVGTEPHDPTQRTGVYNTGRGGAIQNYVETTYGAQKITVALISAGVFDRYPSLKMLVSEGGATWGPFMADRMDEAYRQHSAAVRPKLSKMPSEYLHTNVYASFQHDPLCGTSQRRHGLEERPVGKRLSPHRGNLRPHPEDPPRAIRRHQPGRQLPDAPRRLPRALPARPRTSRGAGEDLTMSAFRPRAGSRQTSPSGRSSADLSHLHSGSPGVGQRHSGQMARLRQKRMIQPPSTLMVCPVIHAPASETSSTSVPTRSSGGPSMWVLRGTRLLECLAGVAVRQGPVSRRRRRSSRGRSR